LKNWQKLLSGGLAGVACWVSSYPLDTIKSNIQARQLNKPVSFIPSGLILHESLDIHTKAGGYRGFYSGVVAIMGRAFFANAVGFWLWEFAKNNIHLNK
jgi:solute carrier family 25 carnitine/acylcarnitine transporter 20/29